MHKSALMDRRPLFFLGANDSEMDEIGVLLREVGALPDEVFYPTGTSKDAPRLAYGGWSLDVSEVTKQRRVWGGDCPVVLIECRPSNLAEVEAVTEVIRIDHHFPGDAGFGKRPALAVEASSLGQLAAHLETYLDPKQKIIAALDHCAAAACQGKCPIPAEEAQEVYLSRLTPEIRALVPEAIDALKAAPLAGALRDLTGNPDLHPKGRLGAALVAAALVSGEAYIGWGTQGDSLRDGVPHRHIGVGGFGEGTVLGAIAIEGALSGFGAVGIYGDPVRGMGGGYVPLIRWAVCHGPTASVISEGLSPDFELDRDLRAALKAAEARAPLQEIDIRGGGRWMVIESPSSPKGQIFFGLTAYRRECYRQEGQCRELTPVDGVVDTGEEVLKLLPE